MRIAKRFYFIAALCLSALVFSCDIPAAGSEPIPVRITDSGVVFDSVEIVEQSSRLPLDESEEYHP